MPSGHPFSPEAYASLAESFLSQGYTCADFATVSPGMRHLIVRHDVDFCLRRAERMAELDAELGLTATYFVLVSSNFYNILSRDSRGSLHKILACGHRVGLHFDPVAHDNLEAGMEQEKRVLEATIGDEISIVSFHRPHDEWLNSPKRICGLPHTYEPRFFSEIAYVSDSRGDWHHGHPLDHQAVRDGRALQLLTHPIWWIHSYGSEYTPTTALSDFAEESGSNLHRNIMENCTSYQP